MAAKNRVFCQKINFWPHKTIKNAKKWGIYTLISHKYLILVRSTGICRFRKRSLGRASKYGTFFRKKWIFASRISRVNLHIIMQVANGQQHKKTAEFHKEIRCFLSARLDIKHGFIENVSEANKGLGDEMVRQSRIYSIYDICNFHRNKKYLYLLILKW